jgi:hypothetical protein
MALNITINTIPHSQHRYPTVSDYFLNGNGQQQFLISDMGNKDYEFLVAIHELIEQHLTEKRGISEESITKFDEEFEAKREEGNLDEPGNDPKAPYWKEHQFATKIEKLVADELGVDWVEYDNAVCEL